MIEFVYIDKRQNYIFLCFEIHRTIIIYYFHPNEEFKNRRKWKILVAKMKDYFRRNEIVIRLKEKRRHKQWASQPYVIKIHSMKLLEFTNIFLICEHLNKHFNPLTHFIYVHIMFLFVLFFIWKTKNENSPNQLNKGSQLL